MSTAQNEARKERRRSDPEWAARERESKRRSWARSQAQKSGAPIPEELSLQKGGSLPVDPVMRGLRDAILLNHEDLEIAAVAKRSCKHRMDCVMAMALHASNAAEPPKEKKEEEVSEEDTGNGPGRRLLK